VAKHLLIADDEPSVLAVLRIYFMRLGYQVTTARNGQEAVDLAIEVQPDLIILDIQMPKKTGLEALLELRALPAFADRPILALTAHVRDFLPSTVLQAGFNQLLTKPLEFSELQEVVVTLLNKH
jgi:two-component system, OmpR family, alkaline phosphatase synthesis response regulator PhoP